MCRASVLDLWATRSAFAPLLFGSCLFVSGLGLAGCQLENDAASAEAATDDPNAEEGSASPATAQGVEAEDVQAPNDFVVAEPTGWSGPSETDSPVTLDTPSRLLLPPDPDVTPGYASLLPATSLRHESDVVQWVDGRLFTLEGSRLSMVDALDPRNLADGVQIDLAGTGQSLLRTEHLLVVLLQEPSPEASETQTAGCRTTERTTLQVFALAGRPLPHALQTLSVPGRLLRARADADRVVIATDDYFGCNGQAAAYVHSFITTDSGLQQRDELFLERDPRWSYELGIGAGSEHFYVSGTTYGYFDAQGRFVENPEERLLNPDPHAGPLRYESRSRVFAVAVSNDGVLSLGAEVELAGELSWAWQFDEVDSILRLVLERHSVESTPILYTFNANLEILGSLELPLARPRALNAVHFDGPRAYVASYDPEIALQVLDLTDPFAPRLAGSVDLGGSPDQLIPRGTRVYVTGRNADSDWGFFAAALNLESIDSPELSSRVEFGPERMGTSTAASAVGGSQSSPETALLPESLGVTSRLFDADGVWLISYFAETASSPDEGESQQGSAELGCQGSHQVSGLQALELVDAGVSRAGQLQQCGFFARTWLVNDTVYAYTGQSLQSFDLGDRNSLVELDDVAMSRSVQDLLVVADRLVRLGNDEAGRRVLDVVGTNEPNAPLSGQAIALTTGPECGVSFGSPLVSKKLASEDLASENIVYVPRYARLPNGRHAGLQLDVVDVGGSTPKQLPGVSLPAFEDYLEGGVVSTESALVVLRFRTANSERAAGLRLDVVDLTVPEKPEHVASVDVPEFWVEHGFGAPLPSAELLPPDSDDSLFSLVSAGDVLASQHYEPAPDAHGVRYFLNRLDLSEPSRPEWLPELNIPGQLVALDESAERVLALAPERVEIDCETSATCSATRLRLHALELAETATGVASWSFDAAAGLVQLAQAEDTLFIRLSLGQGRLRVRSFGLDASATSWLDVGSEAPELEANAGSLVRFGASVGLSDGTTHALLADGDGELSLARHAKAAEFAFCDAWQMADSKGFCPRQSSGIGTVWFD